MLCSSRRSSPSMMPFLLAAVDVGLGDLAGFLAALVRRRLRRSRRARAATERAIHRVTGPSARATGRTSAAAARARARDRGRRSAAAAAARRRSRTPATLSDDERQPVRRPSTPIAARSSAVAVAVTSPSSSRTGTNSRIGSSRYVAEAPGRSLRSATRRSDSRISALNAASIAPRYTAAQREQEDGSSGIIVRACPLDQAFAQAALPPQPALDARHRARVALVIVAEQVQQAVQRQHAQLGRARSARPPAPGAAPRRGR